MLRLSGRIPVRGSLLAKALCRLASCADRAKNARTTVYPCDVRHGRQHPLPCTLKRTERQNQESTHRTNGPCSRWLLPLSYGTGVKPTSEPSSLPFLIARQENSSITRIHAVRTPTDFRPIN